MLPEIYRIREFGDGFLSVMAKPVGAWIDEEIAGLRILGVDVVVSLLTSSEAEELGLLQENRICEINNIEFISFPIPDRCVPDSFDTTLELGKKIQLLINGGKGIAIHCRAGIGRSGLIAASVLVLYGMQTSEAFKLISNARRVIVPDTEEQTSWVQSFEVSLRNS